MNTLNLNIKKHLYYTAVLLLVLSVLLPVLVTPRASAAGVVTSRSIMMSTSEKNVAATYNVSFKPSSSYTIKGIIVDFCDASPITYSTSCVTGSVGTTIPSVNASPTVTVTSGITGSWTATMMNSNRTLALSKAAGDAVTSGSTITFSINNMTNQNGINTFYARIYTYTSDTAPAAYTLANPDAGVAASDVGGVALSTANTIGITATVQEQLTFCVSSVAPTSGCGGTSAPSIVLGHGTPTPTLSFGQVDPADVFYQVGTNATGTTAINIKGASPNLVSGSNTIARIGSDGAAATIPTNSSLGGFGARDVADTALPNTLGTITAQAPYNGAANNYGMHSGVSGTYGATLATATGALVDNNHKLTFAAAAGTSTPAGIYTANYALIATSTY